MDSRRLAGAQSAATMDAIVAGVPLRREVSPTPFAHGHVAADFASFPGLSAARTTAPSAGVFFFEQPGSAGLGRAHHQPAGYALKRSIDVVGALLALIFFAPLMCVVACLLAVFEKGPILFTQERIGFGGRSFKVMKFRTMRAGGASALDEILASNPALRSEWAIRQKLARDPRITSIGRLLRLSSIDELPQFINILRGDMSLVGPRPIVHGEHLRYGRYFKEYCNTRPGITGLWQVSGRNHTTYRRRVAIDVTYSRKMHWRLDLYVLTMTLPAIIRAEGCY